MLTSLLPTIEGRRLVTSLISVISLLLMTGPGKINLIVLFTLTACCGNTDELLPHSVSFIRCVTRTMPVSYTGHVGRAFLVFLLPFLSIHLQT